VDESIEFETTQIYPTPTLTIHDSNRWTAVVRAMPGAVSAKKVLGGEDEGWYPLPGCQNPTVIDHLFLLNVEITLSAGTSLRKTLTREE
jgi:hypothetical protein